MKEPFIGMSATATRVVDETMLAAAVGSGALNVFATPMMAAMMEEAACTVLAPFLEEGETTVGTELNIRHTAASPQGIRIIAEATITAVNGREISLDVTARDTVGEIGSGTHKRFVVDAARFQSKTDARGQK